MEYLNLASILPSAIFFSLIMVCPQMFQLIPGEMPSPKSLLTTYGISTNWLVAPLTGLPVPTFIGERDTVTIPGTLVFYVKRPETVTPGPAFSVEDSIQLRGHMSK